jgi:hypothetical protein
MDFEALARARRDFDALVADVRPQLLRYCARMTGSAVDGEDIVQEALAKVYFRLPQRAVTPKPAGVLDWAGVCTERVDYRPAAVIDLRSGRSSTSVMSGDRCRATVDVVACGKRSGGRRARCRLVLRRGLPDLRRGVRVRLALCRRIRRRPVPVPQAR